MHRLLRIITGATVVLACCAPSSARASQAQASLKQPGVESQPRQTSAAALASPDFAGYRVTLPVGPNVTSLTGWLSVPDVTCPSSGSPIMTPEVEFQGPTGPVYSLSWTDECPNSLRPITLGFGSKTTGSALTTFSYDPKRVHFSVSSHPRTDTTTLRLYPTGGVTSNVESMATVLAGTIPGAINAISAGVTFTSPESTDGNVSPIPSFSPITFGALRFNGNERLSRFHPTRYAMYDGDVLQASAGPINSSSGSFQVTFEHS